MLREQSLGTTLALGFVSLLVLLAAVVGFTIHEVNATELQRGLLLHELTPAAGAADEIALRAVRIESSLQRFLATGTTGDLLAARQSREELSRALFTLQKVSLSDKEDSYLSAQMQSTAGELAKQVQDADDYLARAPRNDATLFVQRYVRGTVDATVGAAGRLRERLSRRATEVRGQISRRDERLARSLVWIFMVTGLVEILLAVFCVRLVTDPVERLSLAARAVEKGDYSLALRLNEQMAAVRASTSQNELTILARAFMHMARTLEEREGRLLSQAERLQAANAQLQALQSLTDVALSDLSVDVLVEQLLQRVIGGIGARSGAVFLADASSGRLEPRAAVQPQAPEENGQEQEWMAALASRVVTAGQLTVSDDAGRDPDASRVHGRAIGSYIAAPIRVRDEVIGAALVTFTHPQTFSPTTVNLMQVFAERLERALERSRAVEELETRRRELERQVAQQQQQILRQERMASIGLLGSGIAHELRNPLGVISNAVYFLRHHIDVLDEKALRHLTMIDREVRHSVGIIDDLVDFAAGIEPATTRLDLNTLIQRSLEYDPVPEGVRLELELAPDLPSIIGDESQLVQVVEHLVRNAVQAMEGVGRLRISTGAGSDGVWAVFQDSGPGVSAEDQGRIFEPLMSTRAKGMGLGLAICRKILEAHGGGIRLVSKPGRGATFIVELPVSEKLPLPAVEMPVPTFSPLETERRALGD